MVDRQQILSNVEAAAKSVLGDRAGEWMLRPSAVLDGMAPIELASSPEGARVILHELAQPSTRLRAKSWRSAAELAKETESLVAGSKATPAL